MKRHQVIQMIHSTMYHEDCDANEAADKLREAGKLDVVGVGWIEDAQSMYDSMDASDD